MGRVEYQYEIYRVDAGGVGCFFYAQKTPTNSRNEIKMLCIVHVNSVSDFWEFRHSPPVSNCIRVQIEYFYRKYRVIKIPLHE